MKPEYSVLDFGCGTGIITIELAQYVKSILAIDISKNMIEFGKS
ncbi:MAG: class I SAM-dependent methyltransferase [Anaerolineales bacterium]|nr:class I SAM-dependent methyltransferase [Anaerolineales bacterium]